MKWSNDRLLRRILVGLCKSPVKLPFEPYRGCRRIDLRSMQSFFLNGWCLELRGTWAGYMFVNANTGAAVMGSSTVFGSCVVGEAFGAL